MKKIRHKVSSKWIENMLRESSQDEDTNSYWGNYVVYRITLESSHLDTDGLRKIEVIEKVLMETEPKVLTWSMAWAYLKKFSEMNPGEFFDMDPAGLWGIAGENTQKERISDFF